MMSLWRGGEPIPALLLFGFVVSGLLFYAFLSIPLHFPSWILALFAFYLAFDTFFTSSYFVSSFRVFFFWFFSFAVYWVTEWMWKKLPEPIFAVQIAVDILGASALLSSLLGLWALWGSGNLEAPLTGTFYWHNPFSAYLGMIGFPFLARFFSVTPRARVSYAIGMGILLVSLLLTRSRGGLLTFLLALLYFLFRLRRSRRPEGKWVPLVVLGGGAMLLFLFFLRPDLWLPLIQRFQQALRGEQSVLARLEFWVVALKIASVSPLFGVGLGNYGDFFPRFQSHLEFYTSDPHNLLLQVLSETGFIGFLFFILFLFAITHSTLRSPLPEGWAGLFKLSLEASLLGALAHSFLDFDWSFPAFTAHFFFFTGLLSALSSSHSIKASKPFRSAIAGSLTLVAVVCMVWMVRYGISQHLWVQSQKALLSDKSDKMEVAMEKIHKAVSFFPYDASFYSWMAEVEYERGNREGLKYAEEAVRLHPMQAGYRNLLGKYLILIGDLDAGERELLTALRMDPYNRPSIYASLARYYLQSNQLEKAEGILNRALNLYPFTTSEEVFRTQLHWRNLRMNEVIADLHTLRAILLLRQGKVELAEEEKKRAQQLIPVSPP